METSIQQLSQRLLDLELGDWDKKSEYDILLVNSRMSAIMTVVLTLADNEGRFMSSSGLYSDTRNLFERFLPRIGIECTMVTNPLDIEEWEHRLAITSFVRFLFAENYNVDNRALAHLAHRVRIPYISDRSMSNAVLEPLIPFEVDVVIHEEGLGSAIIARKELIQKIRNGWFGALETMLKPEMAQQILIGK